MHWFDFDSFVQYAGSALNHADKLGVFGYRSALNHARFAELLATFGLVCRTRQYIGLDGIWNTGLAVDGDDFKVLPTLSLECTEDVYEEFDKVSVKTVIEEAKSSKT